MTVRAAVGEGTALKPAAGTGKSQKDLNPIAATYLLLEEKQ